MRRTPLLFAAVLSLGLPAFAVTAQADGPVISSAVSSAYEEARHRVDMAARRMTEARDSHPAPRWDEARAAVETAQRELVRARRLFDEGKRQGNVGAGMGPMILHGLASDLRRLAEVQKSIPPAVLPVAESTPETQAAAGAALAEAARGLEAELEKFRKEFGGKPATAMDAAADALRQIRELLATAARDPNARAALPEALAKVRAFHAQHRTEWLALLATLEEIQHLRIELRAASKPKGGGGLAGAITSKVTDPIKASSLPGQIAAHERVANGIATTTLSLR